ncbi:MAG: UDP-3-O-(3-hydroxymyristoyl)glucosamine N-acyltransferase [Desulfobacterales bacterium]|jgi:UDP-3-O-[3-hydroxymyristoyl] glucosamine N-acyltransferase|nr:UDP-3-O-(3-hydroxymyristoyl)glucosamine N-acyltransferase [Desulfobacterales bacterium]
MPSYTLSELAEHVAGKVIGDPNLEIRAAASLEQAAKGDISFLANPKYAPQVKTTRASAIVVKETTETSASLLLCQDPYYAFMLITVLLHGHRRHALSGISNRAAIAPDAVIGTGTCIGDFASLSEYVSIGKDCVIYPGVFIGSGTVIGDNCILYPNVVIYERCRIGNRVIIHANATIGEDGFSFATHNGVHYKIPHIGSVVIEDDVEIGAGSGVERGSMGDTLIGQGCKVGDSVVIGHGTKMGPHCLLVPQVGIAGSTTLGHHCVAGGQAGIAGHLNIGNGVMIGAQSGVGDDAADGEKLFGYPAYKAEKAKRAYVLIRRLPEIWKELKKLRARVDEIDGKG